MGRAYYSKELTEFLTDNNSRILGELTNNNQFSLEEQQRNAWIQQIQILKNGASTSTSTGFQKGNDYEVIQLGQYEALQWLSTEKPIIGQFTGNYVPIDNTRNINFDTTFPVGYKEKCQPIWEDFVKTIKLE